jgi:hypothetical protein
MNLDKWATIAQNLPAEERVLLLVRDGEKRRYMLVGTVDPALSNDSLVTIGNVSVPVHDIVACHYGTDVDQVSFALERQGWALRT